MQRRVATGALAVAMASVLAVSACSDKSSSGGGSAESSGSSGGGGSSSLKIDALAQIDTSGNEVPKGSTSDAANPAGDGKATCKPTSIAMAGALTGDNAALGLNIRYGAELAVNQHNKANPGCQVTLKTFDTEGDPQKATQVAPQIANDPSIIGLIGPAFSGETKATGAVFNQAGLVSTTASATNPALTTNGWKTFFRGLANDDVQGPAVAKYMTGKLGYKKICVIKDDSEYAAGLAKAITTGLGSANDSSCAGDVKTKERDFSAVVAKVNSAKPDAVFYAGYYAEAAPLAQQLKDGGVTAKFVSGDGVNDPQFVSQAGSAAKGAYLSCPCGPAPEQFTKDYEAQFKQAPGVYSVEAYDLATIMVKGIDSGKTTRPALLDYIKTYDGQGLARTYKWTGTGELTTSLIWMYDVK
ncbi:branched-chain amino acid ABC transporter substrate-binding protein [Williamsia sterculiae]|uniref:Branched-chain amino acid transport system substrate-binding protein n=1 Tax=Williamsia sterculiae TaxID=1344003 RepID=A0A1N7H5C6_9NOCA|nr:branched-chain amino acid ABC transporter substrate-binding protein [Williamsia sterculiae]SIS20023.1 branched-chain amino acid transport system substrate-binding protein [Williamsia sterculiae]